ncbi:MAG: hypothetical protein DBX93_07245, partial [Oscillospiraceae bacterium]
LISPAPTASAARPTAGGAADALYALGLVGGYGKNADGSVNFALGDKLTRAQAFVLVVRFVGAEKDATLSVQSHPFTDVPAWANPYIGYVYANGITKGVSETRFDPDTPVSEAAFLTIMLRVLGYNDGAGDFRWDDPYTLAQSVGIADAKADTFNRGSAFVICYRALTATVKSGNSIAEQLIAKGVFTKETYDKAMNPGDDTPIVIPGESTLKTVITPIAELNTKGEDGDHADDDFNTVSLEIDYRQTAELTSAKTGYSRYDNAWYPRVKKVRDDLYLLLYHYGQYGQHIYWTTSRDGVKWNAPSVLYRGGASATGFTHAEGPLAGTKDDMRAVNPDACVLDNGDILCVYSVRSNKGYQQVIDLNGLELVRGKVTASGGIQWSKPTKIYTGTNWEPFIMQRDDGQIEIYFSSSVTYIAKYGFDKAKRSSGTGLIVSKDGGYTWTPDVQAGDKNYYRPTVVYQQAIGEKKTPNGETAMYFSGQMPSVVQLYNGKSMIAVEVHSLNNKYTISLATSEAGGNWKDLGITEEGPSTMMKDVFTGAAPYLARFKSGEVYLTYTSKGLKGRMAKADGTAVSSKEFTAVPGAAGSWGSTEIVGSHAVLSTAPVVNGDKRGVKIVRSYLNHRINAPKTAVTVDGYTNDWDNIENTDALFVGSESQAQITLRAAHDDENVYFLVSRLDDFMTSSDAVMVCIGAGETADYRVVVGVDGSVSIDHYSAGAKQSSITGGTAVVKVLGTLNNNEDTDEGCVYEIAVPKSAVGLTGAKSFKVRPVLTNKDSNNVILDTLTGVTAYSTALWPDIVLD